MILTTDASVFLRESQAKGHKPTEKKCLDKTVGHLVLWTHIATGRNELPSIRGTVATTLPAALPVGNTAVATSQSTYRRSEMGELCRRENLALRCTSNVEFDQLLSR